LSLARKFLEGGVDDVGSVIEELIREELVVGNVVEGLSKLVSDELVQSVELVKPLVEADAGKVVRG